MGVVLYGGAFDPPHLGHVAVADAAREHFGVPRLRILVSERPGHRDTQASAVDRLELVRAAFPDDEVVLDPYPRTIELLRAEQLDDPVFVIGADQFCDFLAWAEPDEVLRRATLAVATRPGFPQKRLDAVLARLERSDRVVFFALNPNPNASTDVRARIAAGEPPDAYVPPAVADSIRARRLYVRE